MKCSKTFLVAVILNAIFIYIGSDIMFMEHVELLVLLQESYIWNLTAYISPLLVCLPYVTRFYEEKESGYYRIKIMRQGKVGYAMKHVWQAMVSGAMVMLFSILLFTVIIYIYAACNGLTVSLSAGADEYGDQFMPSFYYNLVQQGKGWIVYVLHIISLMCYGMIWPCYGMIASLFVTNRRLAVVFPFLLKRLLEFMPDALLFLSARRLRFEGIMAYMPLGGFLYAATYVLVAFLVTVLLVYLGMKLLMKRQG